MTLGITVGKFYPFHLGHDHLIRQAKAQVDRLVVLLGHTAAQHLPGPLRAGWIEALHPDVEVIQVREEELPEAPEPWGRVALEVLAGRRPDVAFTSEEYGPAWAACMGARHVLIDLDREAFPISGTALRSDLGAHWAMLTPPAKAHFARRVTLLGAESSGTTTLARALAEHYRTAWVPEYGRWYWEGRRHAPQAERWSSDEFLCIARGQGAWEDDLARQANKLLVCDTDALATCVWHRRYVGHDSPALEALADGRRSDLYLLTEPDFPFVQDGSRESAHLREEMHRWFLELLEAKGKRFLRLSGPPEARLAAACAAIDPLLRFEPLADP